MLTIAVTGGIGSGKSTAAAALASRGALLVDSDALARAVVAPGSPGLAAVAAAFGGGVVAADGALDRAALAAIVFADPAARDRLELITHPLVRQLYADALQAAPADAVVVNDIPILRDLGVAARYHLVLTVTADPEVRVQRLIARGLGEGDARARIGAQIGDDERALLSDVIVDNSGDRPRLEAAVAELWDARIAPFGDNVLAGRVAARSGPRLVDPDPTWPATARRLAARVSAAVGGSARVDHIGSTAIPDMPAKDVIDLQLTADGLAQADGWADALTAAGFPRPPGDWWDTPHPAGDDPARWRKRLHGNADPDQTVNLHVRVRDSPGWRWALLFRDWLRADPAVAADYLRVKTAAAVAHATAATVDPYAQAKEPWLARAYDRGLAWAAATGWAPG